MHDRQYLIAFGVGFIFGAAAAPWLAYELLKRIGI